jgi:RNA polymerase sigma-70 factor (ECF subfamily)
MSTPNDWDLVARARSGDTRAFEELVRRYQTPVIHFCQRMLGSTQEAEDIAQDSFVRIYRHLDRLRPDAKFSTVLFGIARNLTLNYIRDMGRRGRGVTDSLTRDDETERSLEAPQRGPDEVARVNEIQDVIEQGLALLSEEHREVLVLREVQGLDYDTIGDIIGCRKGTVKSRLARAREQLRMRLQELGGDLL